MDARFHFAPGLVGVCAVVVVLVRLPLLGRPAWPDEAGFLTVGGGWSLGADGSSLYGDYWVDRPPVLITIFGWADSLGGLDALRLIGALSAAATVLAVADLAHTLAGRRAAGWAALTAAALLSSPYHWAFMVDGELLAGAFVAIGVALTARGLDPDRSWRHAVCAAGGVIATTALLTKQNFADVFVFAAALIGLRLLGGSLGPRRAVTALGSFAAGAIGAAGVHLLWAAAHGTSLEDLWYAMYRFRLDAASTSGVSDVVSDRLFTLGLAAVLSGLALSLVAVLVTAWHPSRRDAAVGALVVLLAFDVGSVLAGTNYWLHYLLQPSVPVAVLLGVLAARGARVVPVAITCVVLACVGYGLLVTSPPQTAEELVGEAVGRAAEPGDELITVYGRSNVNHAAGLRSPYSYLWALPARTLDPDHDELKAILSSEQAPAWFLSWEPLSPAPAPGSVSAIVKERYLPVATVCRRTIYLRADLLRPTPVPAPRASATRQSQCQSVSRLPPVLREIS